MQKQQLLNRLEVLGLGLSGLGLSALLYYQQVVWVAAPLVPLLGTLVLNQVSRRRLAQSRSFEQPLQQNPPTTQLSQTITTITNSSAEVLAVQVAGVVTIEELQRLLINRVDQRTEERVDEAFEHRMGEINELIKNIQSGYNNELVVDRHHSRRYLNKALDEAQNRLVLVCPYLSQYAIDSNIEKKIQNALDRGVCIDIGWGRLEDMGKIVDFSSWKFNKIPWLKQQQERCNRLKLKALGTHEKYLVCDNSWAMLGSHNFLTSGLASSEREVGLYTEDPRIINQLISRFDNAEQQNVS